MAMWLTCWETSGHVAATAARCAACGEKAGG